MNNANKIRNAFNFIIKHGFCSDCSHKFDGEACHKYDCYENGVKVIRETLEKQIPRKPIKCTEKYRYGDVWKCPNCSARWSSEIVNFCYRCGQAIDWSEGS